MKNFPTCVCVTTFSSTFCISQKCSDFTFFFSHNPKSLFVSGRGSSDPKPAGWYKQQPCDFWLLKPTPFFSLYLSGVFWRKGVRISHSIHMRGATPTTTFAEVKTTLFASFSSSSSTNTKASSSRRSFRKRSRFGAFAFAAFTSSSSSGVCSDARGSIAKSESYTDDRVVLLSSSSKGFLVRTKATYSNNDDEVMKKDTKKLIDYGRVGVAFAFPALAGFLFGLDIGVSSGALESIKTSSTDFFALTASQSGQIVSASLFGALTASAVAAAGAGEKLGSRKEIALAGVLYLIGGTMEANAQSVDFLIFAKAIYGLGIGFAMHGAPVYIAETAPSSLRGTLISLKEAAIVFGILCGYFCASQYVGEDGGWRSMFLTSVPFAVLTLVGAGFILPDSPRWLASKNMDSFPALKKLRGPNVSEMELMNELDEINMFANVRRKEEMGRTKSPFAILDKKYAKALYVGLSVVLFQQLTGQPSVLYYATQTFEAAGWSAQGASNIAVVVGVFKLFMTGIAVWKVDSLGRRPLLLGGVSLITLSLMVLALASPDFAGSGVEAAALSETQARISVAAIFLYVGAYQVSFGPIAWLLVGEVFPTKVRSQAVGIATLLNFGSNFIVSLNLPYAIEQIGIKSTYFGFASIGVLSVASIYFSVVETKGKTLEEIEDAYTVTATKVEEDR